MWISIEQEKPKHHQLCLVMLEGKSKNWQHTYYPKALCYYDQYAGALNTSTWIYCRDKEKVPSLSELSVIYWTPFKLANHIWLNPIGTRPNTARCVSQVFQHASPNNNWFEIKPSSVEKRADKKKG